MSALSLIAGIDWLLSDVRFMPIADVRRFRKHHCICCQASALLVFSFAAGGCSLRSGVKLVWFAEAAVSAERCAAFFDSEKPTVSPARSSVGSAPFIGVSGGRTGDEG